MIDTTQTEFSPLNYFLQVSILNIRLSFYEMILYCSNRGIIQLYKGLFAL